MKKSLFITILALSVLQFSGEIFAMEQDKNEESKKRETDDSTREGQAPTEKQRKTELAPCYFDKNGFDDSLIMLILSFCDIETLGKSAKTCKRFNAISKNPELLQGILQTLLSCNAKNPTSVIRYADATKILKQYPYLQNAALFQNQAEALIVEINNHIKSLADMSEIIEYIEEFLKTGFDNSDIFNKITPVLSFTMGRSYILLDLFLKYCCREIIASLYNQGLINLTPDYELTERIIRGISRGSNFAIKIGNPERFASLFKIIAGFKQHYYRRDYLRPDMKVNPILIAAQEGSKLFTMLLMQKKFDILSTSEDGSNVLHLAIENNQYDFVKWVLSLDFKIVTKLLNQGKINGETPIQTAIRKNNIPIVTAMVKMGAKNVTDKSGNTFLHYAVESASLPMVQFILNYVGAANIHTTNNIGISPISMASVLGYTEIYAYLEKEQKNQQIQKSDKCSIQ